MSRTGDYNAPRKRRIGRAPIVLGVLAIAAWTWWVPFAVAAWLDRDTRPARAFASASSSTYYRTCGAAQMAGAAPMERGEPGYRPGLDSDGDGTACD